MLISWRVWAPSRAASLVPATRDWPGACARFSDVCTGPPVVDADAGTALRDGTALDLTATELRLLAYLAAQRGRTVGKLQILTQVWGYGDYDPNLVEVHVSALRRKLEAHGPRVLHTVRGLGYVLRG